MKEKMDSVKISKVDSVFEVELNGVRIKNVQDYKLTSSADGTTELELKMKISDAFMKFESSAGRTERTSSD